jgi:hypothetical protein
VFPRPQATTAAEFVLGDAPSAIAVASTLARGRVNLDALDVLPNGTLLARLGGLPELLASRADRLARSIDAPCRVHAGHGERELWRDASELDWVPPDSAVVRVGLSPARALELADALAALEGIEVRYAIACTTGWIACTTDRLDALDAVLLSLRMPGVVLRGTVDRPLLGPATGGAFGARVAAAIDPRSRFLELERWIVSRL